MKDTAGRQITVMGSCYALGTFADNFYKQAAVLMAAAAGMTGVQGMATVLFSLPFVLFPAWAGWISDRVAKKHIVVAAKALELLAMLAGGWMLLTANWTGILAVMFLMASQSTLFSPAINGSIPEIFPVEDVPRVNAMIKFASTAAILAGVAFAGVVLDLRPEGLVGLLPSLIDAGGEYNAESSGRAAAAIVLAAISCTGILTALLLRKTTPSGDGRSPFPWTGPLDSFRHALACRADPPLFFVLVADAWFYGISVVTVISIANLTTNLGHSKTMAGIMAAILMVGVALGSLLAGRHSAESWKRLFLPSALGISALLMLCGLTPLLHDSMQIGWLGGCLLLCGLCGGMYLIPLESYIQVRPAPAEKGKIIAVSNLLSFTVMAVFGALFVPVSLLPPALTFVVFGLGTICFIVFWGAPVMRRLPDRNLKDAAAGPLGLVARALLSLRYRVREEGLDALQAPNKGSEGAMRPGILFLPNHPALIDPVILYSRLSGLCPRPLSDHRQMSGPLQRFAGRLARVITIPDLNPEAGTSAKHRQSGGRRADAEKVRQGIAAVADALRQGENVILYPSGRIYHSGREHLGNNSAAARVLDAVPNARVVLVRTTGLWGSSFSRAGGARPSFMGCLAQGALTLLGNLLFFAPRRTVRIQFAEYERPDAQPGGSDGRVRFNKRLEDFYNAGEEEAPHIVPRFFWSRPFLG